VSSEEIPRDVGFDEASARLRQGLRICRAVVERYRSMIGNELNDGSLEGRPDMRNKSDPGGP
jgi:hypothetical protein